MRVPVTSPCQPGDFPPLRKPGRVARVTAGLGSRLAPRGRSGKVMPLGWIVRALVETRLETLLAMSQTRGSGRGATQGGLPPMGPGSDSSILQAPEAQTAQRHELQEPGFKFDSPGALTSALCHRPLCVSPACPPIRHSGQHPPPHPRNSELVPCTPPRLPLLDHPCTEPEPPRGIKQMPQ